MTKGRPSAAPFYCAQSDLSAGDEFVGGKALKIQQSGQIGVVQLQGDLFTKKGLAVKGDTKTGRLKHRQIIRPVTNAGRVHRTKAKLFAIMRQVTRFGILIQYRLAHTANKRVTLYLEMVRMCVVKPALRRHWLGDGSEPARD